MRSPICELTYMWLVLRPCKPLLTEGSLGPNSSSDPIAVRTLALDCLWNLVKVRSLFHQSTPV